jgi:glutamyl-tRNA reductase
MSKQIVGAEISLANVPSHIRRIFGYNEEKIKNQLIQLNTSLNEVFILSTDSRFAVFALHTDISPLVRFFCRDKELAPYVTYYTRTEESIRHLFCVAGGLYSAENSEFQLIDLMIKSHIVCLESECLGLVTNNLVTEAIRVGETIRSTTGTPVASTVEERTRLNKAWEIVAEETRNFMTLLKQFEISPVLTAYWTSVAGVKKQNFKVSENNKQWSKKYTREFDLSDFSATNTSRSGEEMKKEEPVKRLSRLYNINFMNFFQN